MHFKVEVEQLTRHLVEMDRHFTGQEVQFLSTYFDIKHSPQEKL